VPVPAKPLTQLSGRPAPEAARTIANFPPERAISELLALEDEQAAKILIECDGVLAGHLLSLPAAQPAWTRKVIEMVARARAAQFLGNMTAASASAALALPPVEVAAQVLSRTGDDVVRDVLSELSRNRPSRAAPLALVLDDLEAGRLPRVLGAMEPVAVARLLHYMTTPQRRQRLLAQLSRQFRPLVEKHLATLAAGDLPARLASRRDPVG
jgi:flagellar motility protein MotE (MotC chaperone)